MKIFYLVSTLLTLTLPSLAQENKPESKHVSIFDGKTMNGWNLRKGEEKLWTVRDGMIVGGDMKNDVKKTTFIATDKTYQNFELLLDLRFVEGTGFMNSGIQVRSLRRHDHEMIGYQVDAGVRWWGKIYDECRRNRPITSAIDQEAMMKAIKPYGWNRYRILCEGKRIRTWINGVPTIDYTEKAPNIAQDGILGLQVHAGGAFEIQFKNITIKELPPTPGAPTWQSIKDAKKKAQEAKKKAQAPKKVEFAKKTQSTRTAAFTPKQQQAGFKVPEGFVVELVASEKDGIINPIDLTFDDAGRLWTQTARLYPLDPSMGPDWNKFLKKGVDNRKRIHDLYQGKVKGADDILVLTNYTQGKKAKVHQFASGLTIPQSVLPYKNGVYVAQGSELFFLDDTNRDGKADKRTLVLSGFGIADSHTMAHSLVRGPGGWIHFSQGALNRGEVTAAKSGKKIPMNYSKTARFSLDGSQLELINSGLNNIWGYQLRSNGEWYQQEANDSTYSATPAEIGTGFRGIGNQRLRSYQPIRPPLHRFSVGGTGISGLAFSDDTAGGFPKEWKDVGFIANPITSRINCVKIVRNPNGTITAKHLPDFLISTDDWFRPVNLEFGPDGCLYIADWYNQVIAHGEVPLNHPGRDKEHGRIWRIRPVAQQAQPIPNLYKVSTPELVNHLKSPILWQKRAAWHQISDRPSKETKTLAPALTAIASDVSQETSTRVHAIWSLESIGHYDEKLIDALLVDKDDAVQRETLRSLAYLGLKPELVASKVRPFINSPNVKLRSQAIRTLDELNAASLETVDILVSFCRPLLPGNALGPDAFKDKRNHVFRNYANQTGEVIKPMGGPYERSFERYLARKALEKYPKQLEAYLKSKYAAQQPASHLVWAMQALGDKAAPAFADIWNQIKDKELDTSNLIIISNMAKHKQVYQTVLPKFKDPANAKQIVQLSLASLQDVYTTAFAKLLEHPVTHVLSSKIISDKDSELQKQALQIVQKFSLPIKQNLIPPHLEGPHASDALRALARNPKPNKEVFVKILDDPKTAENLWLIALPALAKADLAKAQTYAAERLKKNPAIKSSLISALGSSANGTTVIVHLVRLKLMTADDISFDTADRILGANRKDALARSIAKHTQDKRSAAHQANLKRLPSLIKLAEKKGGNPAIGEGLFKGMCLACHTAGGEGGGLAPALDGSSNRSAEGVLSSILDPDAAIEGAYVLYRVYTKSGDIIDGYRVRSDKRGTIIGNIGNSRFIPAHDISRAGYIGRSFMSFGLINEQTPDEVVEHILSYIRTMK